VQGTAEFHYQIADALLPQADPVLEGVRMRGTISVTPLLNEYKTPLRPEGRCPLIFAALSTDTAPCEVLSSPCLGLACSSPGAMLVVRQGGAVDVFPSALVACRTSVFCSPLAPAAGVCHNGTPFWHNAKTACDHLGDRLIA
jgi:hypothetical protein